MPATAGDPAVGQLGQRRLPELPVRTVVLRRVVDEPSGPLRRRPAPRLPPAAGVTHEQQAPVGQPRRLTNRLVVGPGDRGPTAGHPPTPGHRRPAIRPDPELADPQLRRVPRHVRVVPAHPRHRPRGGRAAPDIGAVQVDPRRGEEVPAVDEQGNVARLRPVVRRDHLARVPANVRVGRRPTEINRDDRPPDGAAGERLPDGEHPLPGRRQVAVPPLRPGRRSRREGDRRPPGIEPVDALVGLVDVGHRAGRRQQAVRAAAVLVHPRPQARAGWRNVLGPAAGHGPHEHLPAAVLRPALQPVQGIAVGGQAGPRPAAGSHLGGGERRRPLAVRAGAGRRRLVGRRSRHRRTVPP